MSKVINGYTLVFEPKVKRAYDKELGAGVNATDEEVLAFYDKFGGLILKDGKAVETGKFWKEFCDKKSKKEVKKEVKEEVKEVSDVKNVEVKVKNKVSKK